MADWTDAARGEPTARKSMVEEAKARVEQTVRETNEAMHRALDQKYNLLRVSERRWSVIRWASVAKTMFQHVDVITFEQVSKPLAFDAALAELEFYRTGKRVKR